MPYCIVFPGIECQLLLCLMLNELFLFNYFILLLFYFIIILFYYYFIIIIIIINIIIIPVYPRY
jgi:hypothetical protein